MARYEESPEPPAGSLVAWCDPDDVVFPSQSDGATPPDSDAPGAVEGPIDLVSDDDDDNDDNVSSSSSSSSASSRETDAPDYSQL